WAGLFGMIELGILHGRASVRLGSANIDTVVKVEVNKAERVTVESAINQVSGEGQFAQVVPAGLNLRQLTQFSISMNLTKSVYLIEGSLEDWGWAYLLYHGSGPTKSEYVFAAGLGTQFKFVHLLSLLGPIDEVVVVKDAMLAIYSVDGSASLTEMKALAG